MVDYTIVNDLHVGVWMIEMADEIRCYADSPMAEKRLLNKLAELKEVLER